MAERFDKKGGFADAAAIQRKQGQVSRFHLRPRRPLVRKALSGEKEIVAKCLVTAKNRYGGYVGYKGERFLIKNGEVVVYGNWKWGHAP